MSKNNDIQIQRNYYSDTATKYEQLHGGSKNEEHELALSILCAALDQYKWKSVLDVGSGTGQRLNSLRNRQPKLTIKGIEPVRELREQGLLSGLPEHILVEGDGTDLKFQDEEFDVVCAFGVLHHVKYPDKVVAEMLRVAKLAIFISDTNNFGAGSPLARFFKQSIRLLKLWKILDAIKTRGKGYLISEEDGLYYSYSVFNNYQQIRRRCKSVHIVNTKDAGVDIYRSAGHVAILGIK